MRMMLMAWLLSFGWLFTHGVTAIAQSDCPYAIIRVEIDPAPNTNAICTAARPLSEAGYRVFVLLTDRTFANEAEWFAYLDAAETEAGLRDPRAEDGFARNGVALEVTTQNAPWNVILTYGERLFGTPLDNEATIDQIKEVVRRSMAENRVETGIAQALARIASTVGTIHMSADTPEIEPGSPAETSSSWMRWLLGLGILGGASVVGWKMSAPLRARHREEARLRAHLNAVQSATTTILAALDTLLSGLRPEETTLYHMFRAYHGHLYDDLDAEVRDMLRQAQAALRDAFDVYASLNDAATRRNRPLEEQVRDWELLYLTLVGTDERIRALTDEQVRELLDPLSITENQPPEEGQLARQLDALRADLRGKTMRVALQFVDPTKVDRAGILGLIDRVKAHIAHLYRAQQQAPQEIADARARRDALAAAVPDDFVMPVEDLLAPIDEYLTRADDLMRQQRYLDVLDLAEELDAMLDAAEAFVEAVRLHREHLALVEAAGAEGYRPPDLPNALRAADDALSRAMHALSQPNGIAAQNAVDAFIAATLQVRNVVHDWRTLHQANAARFESLKQRAEQVRTAWEEQTRAEWEALHAYPSANWDDIEPRVREAEQALQTIPDALTEADRFNALHVQDFTRAAQRLTDAAQAITLVQNVQQLVSERLQAVRNAEQHIDALLQKAVEELHTLEALHKREDRRLDKDIDERLQTLHTMLDTVRRLIGKRHYAPAQQTLNEALGLLTETQQHISEQLESSRIAEQDIATKAMEAQKLRTVLEAALDTLPESARTPELLTQVNAARRLLNEAEQARSVLPTLADEAFHTALEETRQRYTQALDALHAAHEQVQIATNLYHQTIEETRQLIEETGRVLAEAEALANHPMIATTDLQTLEEARRMFAQLRRIPLEGASLDTLRRIQKEAAHTRTYTESALQQFQRVINQVERQRRSRAIAPTSLGMARTIPRATSLRPVSRPHSTSHRATRSSTMGRSKRR